MQVTVATLGMNVPWVEHFTDDINLDHLCDLTVAMNNALGSERLSLVFYKHIFSLLLISSYFDAATYEALGRVS